MGDIIITRRGNSLVGIVNAHYGITEGDDFQGRLEAIKRVNPRLPREDDLPDGTPILLPDDEADTERLCRPDYQNTVNQLYCEPVGSRARLRDALDEHDPDFLTALAEFAEEYNLWAMSADLNTYGGAGLGQALKKAGRIYEAIDEVDQALNRYVRANSASADKGVARQALQQAYRRLQTQFGQEIRRFMRQRPPSWPRRPQGLSTRHALRMVASETRGNRGLGYLRVTDTVGVRRLSKFMKHGQVLGRVMIFTDLGFRGTNVYLSAQQGRNWQRTATQELFGLAGSMALGGGAALFIFGPYGILIALVAVGALAILGDYGGKFLGGIVYDGYQGFRNRSVLQYGR